MAFAGRQLSFCGPGDDSLMNQLAVTDPEAYPKLFASAGERQVAGEGSVSTLYYHELAIPNIRCHAPDAKLIAILRDPAERAFSSFMYMTSLGMEPCTDFRSALDDEERRIRDNWHHIWHYVRMGRYAEQLGAFQRAFSPEQIRFYLLDDLQQNPKPVLQDLFRFLEVDDGFEPETKREINRSGKPRNQLLQRSMQLLRRSALIKRLVKTVVPAATREKIRAANLEHPEIPRDIRAELIGRFRDDIAAVEDVTKRRLPQWYT